MDRRKALQTGAAIVAVAALPTVAAASKKDTMTAPIVEMIREMRDTKSGILLGDWAMVQNYADRLERLIGGTPPNVAHDALIKEMEARFGS